MADRELARQVKEDNKSVLLSMPNVVGVGVGEKTSDGRKTGEVCVVILVREKLPEAGLARDEADTVLAGRDVGYSEALTTGSARRALVVSPLPEKAERQRQPVLKHHEV